MFSKNAVLFLLVFMLPMMLSKAVFAEEAKQVVTDNPVVLMDTTMGKIKIELFKEKAPISVKNFLSYVEDKFYDGTIFHRVIDNFMIQGGGFKNDFSFPSTKPPIRNEAKNGLKNKRGTLAMARTNVIDSASSQFFINVKDNPFLDYRNDSQQGYGYAVFGKVIEGMNVVDKIKVVKTGPKARFRQDAPQENILILSVTIIK